MAWTGKRPPLRASEWEVRPIEISIARRLVVRDHYARGAANTATYLHGLFPAGALFDEEVVGVAWWIPPTRNAAAAIAGQDHWQRVLSLSRLAVADGMPGNAATFLMARSVRMIDRDLWPWLVTYADSWRGHSGAIYRASGWRDAGETSPEGVYVKAGRMIARKAGGRTRTHAEMIALGCEFAGRHSKRRFVKDPPPRSPFATPPLPTPSKQGQGSENLPRPAFAAPTDVGENAGAREADRGRSHESER